ncbi:hypothetical protein AbraIFM66950_002398 [Aspergillus brasiliensis]|nr:hypothetical protein AbraIFM66950_002398 [Aspergillus brasiliensis]
MSEKLRMSSCKIMKFHLDGDVYPLDWWESVPTKAPFDISTLPSIDHAMHALHNVKFHLGHICRFLRDDLAAQIREFYDSRGAPGAGQSRMWFIKFLLVLAFGKAFSSRTKSHGAPPGSSWFLRAMSLMPNHTSTGQDSLAVIENLALAALYLYAIDHRERAHSHVRTEIIERLLSRTRSGSLCPMIPQVGQAIRIAQLEGLHTQLPEDELGYLTVRRCRSLWWSLYILDRQISSSLGLPMTVKDIDITALVDPPGAIPEDPTLSLQVRLSQMMSSILSEVYRTDKTQLGPFLEVTRGILQAMASLAEEIEKIFPAGFHASLDIMPHDLRYIILLYHQCVITATRPLLLSVLQARLGKLGRAEEEWHEAVALPKSLLSTGIRSAVKTLEILSDENIVLEKFLPSDLEFAFWAALHLMIARTLFHLDPTEAAPSNAGLSILDEIISSGNRVAEVRRTELTYIQSLFDNLATRTEEEGLHIRALSKVNEADPGTRVGVASEGQPQTSQTDHMTLAWPVWPDTNISSSAWAGESLSGTLDSLDLIGISSQEFLSIVDQIGQQGYTS